MGSASETMTFLCIFLKISWPATVFLSCAITLSDFVWVAFPRASLERWSAVFPRPVLAASFWFGWIMA